MKRLTCRDKEGRAQWMPELLEDDSGMAGALICDRLAAYEDTGLEPCDYSAMAHALEQADREGRCFIGPFVAMIEQSLSGGEMKPQRDQRFNGRYAVVYFDPKKWSSPLIDICGTPYNREEAEERMKVLKAALRRGQDG